MSKFIKDDNLIEKRNAFNEIMWRDRMTLQALRFLSVYLSRINARDINTRKVRFSVKEYMNIMGYKGVFSRKHYESTVDRLFSHVIHRKLESGGIESFPLFKKLQLDIDENGFWYVELDASDDALHLMFDFKDRYFTYQLWNVLHLKSLNQLRMYEILKQYQKAGMRTVKLDELKELLGIEQTEYPMWQDFKRRVLNGCQKALAEKTDLKFTYEPIRNGRGRKVAGIKFIIEKNENHNRQLTFDEFLGYSVKVENNQLTFADFTDEQSNNVIVTETKPTGKRKKPPTKEYTIDELELLEDYAKTCKNQFTDKEIWEVYEILVNQIQEQRRVEGGYRKAYLQEAYAILCDRERQEEVKYRFRYMKSTLKNLLRERMLEQ